MGWNYLSIPKLHRSYIFCRTMSVAIDVTVSQSPVSYLHGLTLIPAWIRNYMPSKVWDEITQPFLNLNGCTGDWRLWDCDGYGYRHCMAKHIWFCLSKHFCFPSSIGHIEKNESYKNAIFELLFWLTSRIFVCKRCDVNSKTFVLTINQYWLR